MKDVLPSAPDSSVAERFLFSGRSGHPPRNLGWSLDFPGSFGKETARNETRFFVRPPLGPRRRYTRTWLSGDTHPLPPVLQEAASIIGTGFGIVFEFPPDFFQAADCGVRATWIIHLSGSRRRSVTALARRGGPFGRGR